MSKALLIKMTKRVLRRANLAITRYDHRYHPLARRMRLLQDRQIDLVFDVGANNGGWANGLRDLGYTGRIVSFEPLSDAFASLQARCAADGAWQAVRTALGDAVGVAELHVAGNSESSSMLPMLPIHTSVLPSSKYVGSETVPVTTLEHAVREHRRSGERLFVKLDAQGFEPKIIEGGRGSFEHILGFQLEMSLACLYEGELLMPEMVNYLGGLGYALMSLEPGFADPASGRLLQVDGIFFRDNN